MTAYSFQRGMGRPGLQQGALHQEVLLAEQRFDLRGPHQLYQDAAPSPGH